MAAVDPGLVVALVSVFGLVVTVAALVLHRPDTSHGIAERLAAAEVYRVRPPEAPPPDGGGGAVKRLALGLADRALRSRNRRARIDENLDRAGMTISAQEWLLVRMSAAVALVALLLLLTTNLLLSLVLGFVLSWVPTALYLKRRISKRAQAFADQMPDVMQLVASSLRSGFSFNQALDGVVREGSQPAAGEFARALAEARIGVPLEDALDKAAARMRSQDLAWAVMAVRISRQVGGNLAEVLLTTVQTMRERGALKRQVRALSAEGRLSGYVLTAMPIGIALWLFLTRRQYVRTLYTTGIGIAMLVAASLALITGAFWLSRVVKVEV